MRRLVLLTLLIGLGARSPIGAAADPLTPGTRVLLDAHNSYPEGGRWADRIDRALSTGLPIAIEQDLVWFRDPKSGVARSIVAHGEPYSGLEPSLKDYFFERIRPIVERALQENRRDEWPIITLNLDFKSDEPGFGKGGTGVLKVDGKEVANQKIPHTIPFLMTLGETFDIGSDTRTSVDDGDYQVPFAFTGKVENVSVQLN